jgi:hypothetical protein
MRRALMMVPASSKGSGGFAQRKAGALAI